MPAVLADPLLDKNCRSGRVQPDGDAGEASRLAAEADAARAPGRPGGARKGGPAQREGYDGRPAPRRAGATQQLTPPTRHHPAPWGRVRGWWRRCGRADGMYGMR